MELTAKEEKLINTIREIDKVNPLGIDDYTSDFLLNMFLKMAEIYPPEAARRYELFLKQSKGKKFVDIREAQRPKQRFEDIRQGEEAKAEYEANYQKWMSPAPTWIKTSKSR